MLRCARLAESGSANQRSRNGTDSDHGIRMSPFTELLYTPITAGKQKVSQEGIT